MLIHRLDISKYKCQKIDRILRRNGIEVWNMIEPKKIEDRVLEKNIIIIVIVDCITLKARCSNSLKGGIPAAPSGTATLLRLSPSHRSYLR